MNTGSVVKPTALVVLIALISAAAYRVGTGLSGIQGPAQGTQMVSVAATDGPALFGGNCAGCHGGQAQGGVGPKLVGLLTSWSAAQFSAAVLDGQAPEGRALAPTMPHFRTAGFDGQPPTDAQLAATLAFLKGLYDE